MRLTGIVALSAVALAPGVRAADESAAAARPGTFAEAVRALRVGDRVVVKRASGQSVRGRVSSPSPLAVAAPGAAEPLALPEEDVARLAVLRPDPLWNGALIGLGVGASVVFAADCNSPGCDEVQPYAVAGVLALGVGIGALVDHLHRAELVLYEAPRDRRPVAVSVAPLLGERRGVALRIRWGGSLR